MIATQIEINDSALIALFDKINRNDVKTALFEAAGYLKNKTDDRFDTQTDVDGNKFEALSKAYAKRKPKIKGVKYNTILCAAAKAALKDAVRV